MKNNNVLIVIVLICLSTQLFASSEMATFDSFYAENSSIAWGVAAIFAVIAGLVIIFTGGTASPIVISIGSYIGSLSGLSGIAATNYGLALLGGGSIASGGLGIAGGTALLTAALTFSTELVIDFTVTKGVNTYNKSKMIEESKNFLILPIPLNNDGSDEYEKIIEKLKSEINQKELLGSIGNQKVLIEVLNNNKLNDNDLKDLTLKSYLYLVSYKYDYSKMYAKNAIEIARTKNIKRTLPAYIYALSSIYDEVFSFEEINEKYFRYSILAETDNELIPLMFSIYFQNIMFRLNSTETFDYKVFDDIRKVSSEIIDRDIRNKVLVLVITKYLEQLKIEQQRILSLAKSNNDSIKYSPKTVEELIKSLNQYSNLLFSLEEVMNDEFVKGNKELIEMNNTFIRYQNKEYLELLIKNFKDDQNRKLEQNRKDDEIKELKSKILSLEQKGKLKIKNDYKNYLDNTLEYIKNIFK